MKIRVTFLIFLCLSLFQMIEAQSIHGNVVDNKNVPIEGVTVIVESSDSTFIEGTITNTLGEFRFKSSPKYYKLKFQHLLYKPKSILVKNNNVSTVFLDDNDYTIGEVVVKGSKPIVKIDDGKMIYNLSSLTQNKMATNAFDALGEIPGIIRDEDELNLVGSQTVNIIINGKISTMTKDQVISLLKSTPIEYIEKVEVMYSAPAQYHVRGAVINLIMKKYGNKDLNGEVKSSYTNKYVSNWLGGFNLRYSTDKLSTDFMFSTNTEDSKTLIDLESNHYLNNDLYLIKQEQNIVGKELKYNAHFSFDYSFNKSSELNISYMTTFTPRGKGTLATSGNYMSSISNQSNSNEMHNLSFTYKLRSILQAGIDYTLFNSDMNQSLFNESFNNKTSSFKVISAQDINKISTYIDGENKLGNAFNTNYGLALNFTNDFDCQEYKDINGNLEYDNTKMTLREQTISLYAGISKSDTLGNSYSISVTGEYYKMNNYKQWAIYPQINLLYNISNKHMLQFSLSSDKIYPNYWQMQNSISYIDGYSEVHGSPELKPMRKYQATCGYIYKRKYIATLFYSIMPDYFQQAVYQSSGKMALIYQTLNWDFLQNTGASITIPLTTCKWLDSQFTLVGYNLRNKCRDFFDISFDRNKWIGQINLNNSFIINSDIALNISMLYQTPTIQGTYDLESVFNLSLGAKWTFVKKKATLSIRCNDILEKMIPTATVNYMGQNLKMDMGSYSRNLTLTFVYKFGGYKEEKRKEIDMSRFGH